MYNLVEIFSTGRSRAEGGKFYLIFNDRLPNLAERERMNKIRERMMEKATETICDMIRQNKQEYQENVRRQYQMIKFITISTIP